MTIGIQIWELELQAALAAEREAKIRVKVAREKIDEERHRELKQALKVSTRSSEIRWGLR